MKRALIILLPILAIGGIFGVYSAMQPPVHLERSIEINAPTNVVEEKINQFSKNIDSVTRKQFNISFKPEGNKTILTWGYTPQDDDDLILRVVWSFRKDNMAAQMDSALMNMKRVSEKAFQADSSQSK